ncbi:MAG: EamA family transporter [Alphaproteobacteria bacterium]
MWFWYALLSAIFWGLAYATLGKLDKHITPAGFWLCVYLLSISLYAGLWFLGTDWKVDLNAILKRHNFLIITLFTVFIVVGNLAILKAMQNHNPVAVSLIEISYPLFTALFTFILFRENMLTWPLAAGATLVFSGLTVMTVWK